MASKSKSKPKPKQTKPGSHSTHQLNKPTSTTFTITTATTNHEEEDDDDDDFQDSYLPLTQIYRPLINRHNHIPLPPSRISNSQPQPPSVRPPKRPKGSIGVVGKENLNLNLNLNGSESPSCPSKPSPSNFQSADSISGDCASRTFKSDDEMDLGLDCIESTLDCIRGDGGGPQSPDTQRGLRSTDDTTEKKGLKFVKGGGGDYSSNSIESRLLTSIVNCGPNDSTDTLDEEMSDDDYEFETCTQLDVLLELCTDEIDDMKSDKFNSSDFIDAPQVHCPLCRADISNLTDELRQVHTNECLDKLETPNVVVALTNDETGPQCLGQVLDGSPVRVPGQVADTSPVVDWLRSLGLAKYEEIFVREEIDWDTLQWLKDEDLFSIGVTALGPRRKIVNALSEYRKEGARAVEINSDASKVVANNDTRKLSGNKLITEYFPGSVANRGKSSTTSTAPSNTEKSYSVSGGKQVAVKNPGKHRKLRDIPSWCSIQGTPFRVDAFRYLRGDCSHWFLTHFHMDHYQGLTRSFCHGKIYCSLITAKLVNMKIGIPWEKLQVLPLNEKMNIAGTAVTCFDANHCPGSVIILFEPPNGKAVLHTGDFRFSEEMLKMRVFQTCSIQTLILDTTYCNPQYDFPKQEAVIQFVIEAIQAEAFNPKTLFLIGSYTIGKERLFVEVARVLRKKVYVTAAKLHILECLGLPKEDMQWFTLNEQESHIHVVPMWSLASFKRLKHISSQYASRFSLVVAFSPSGWSFGKGKKKNSPGRRWQQGTIIRYEVPYSEHSSYTELREFVKLVSPVNIIPSVNNDGPESSNMMVSLLLS